MCIFNYFNFTITTEYSGNLKCDKFYKKLPYPRKSCNEVGRKKGTIEGGMGGEGVCESKIQGNLNELN